MIAGNPESFAIEVEAREVEGEWIWGGFRFWLGNHQIGDWEVPAALHLCCGWLRKLCEQPPDCVHQGLANSPPEKVFSLVVDPVMGPDGVADPSRQPIPFAYERFHIAHVGMSSFDSYVVVLIKDSVGNERCLWWHDEDATMGDHWLEPGEMERVIGSFCERFEHEFSPLKDRPG